MAGTKPWVVLTSADLYPYLVDAQVKKLVEFDADQTGDPLLVNPFTAVMPDVVAEVRTAIASNQSNALSLTANSVPPECRRLTAVLVIEQIAHKFSMAAPLTELQVSWIKDAKEKLEMIRNWRTTGTQFLISDPDDPETNPSQAFSPNARMTQYQDRLCSRDSLVGL